MNDQDEYPTWWSILIFFAMVATAAAILYLGNRRR